MLAEGIVPLNVEQGYVLRRMIRKAIRHGKLMGIEDEFLSALAKTTIESYSKDYPYLKSNEETILSELEKEYTFRAMCHTWQRVIQGWCA